MKTLSDGHKIGFFAGQPWAQVFGLVFTFFGIAGFADGIINDFYFHGNGAFLDEVFATIALILGLILLYESGLL